MAKPKSNPIREQAAARVQAVKAGADDAKLGLALERRSRLRLLGVEDAGAEVAIAERLARFTILFGKQALAALQDMHEPGGGSVEAALAVMTQKRFREPAGMTERGAHRVVEVLVGLREWDEAKMHDHLRTMGLVEPDALEELAVDVAVVMLRTTIVLEETARLEQWHEAPTLI
jgi:hypothetical protein